MSLSLSLSLSLLIFLVMSCLLITLNKYKQTTWSGDPDTLLPFLKSKMQIVSGHSYNFTRSRACAS